jgi:hypothetical protein
MYCLTSLLLVLYYLAMTDKELKDLEELIYTYGDVMKQIGKCETNDRMEMKEYNKLFKEKESLVIKLDSYFTVSKNVKKSPSRDQK